MGLMGQGSQLCMKLTPKSNLNFYSWESVQLRVSSLWDPVPRIGVNLTVIYEDKYAPKGMVSDQMLIFCSFSCFEIHSIAIYTAPIGAHEIWWIYQPGADAPGYKYVAPIGALAFLSFLRRSHAAGITISPLPGHLKQQFNMDDILSAQNILRIKSLRRGIQIKHVKITLLS